MTKTFDIPRDPADRLAAIVTGPAEELGRFEDKSNVRLDQRQFDDRIKSVLAGGGMRMPKETTNYKGVVNGRVTIIAYSHNRKPNPKRDRIHYWVARCVCGEYEMRSHVSLRRAGNSEIQDMCSLCRRLEHLRWVASGSPTR